MNSSIAFTGTKRDDDLIVAIEARSEIRNLDYSQFQTPFIYGLYSIINAKRLYNEIFTCNFNLKMLITWTHNLELF